MSELKKIWKCFFVWEFEKEDAWLNTMAHEGWVLEKVGFCNYTFRACQPGEYTVRLEMRNNDPAYLSFMEDTGAEYLGRVFSWIYFRRKSELGSFDLYSDIDSRISQLDSIGKMLFCIGIANLLIGVANSLHAPHAGWVNLLCATLLMYALGRIHGKKETLEKDRLLHE